MTIVEREYIFARRRRGGGRGGAGQRGQPLKFDSEFDFESANGKFSKDELEREIEKLKLHDEDAGAAEKEEGEIPATVATHEPDAPKEKDAVVAYAVDDLLGDFEVYDAKKSFFDNLSSDVTDRIKLAERGERQPPIDRREERRKDADTFGDDAYRRTGYRGRGAGARGGGRGGHFYPEGQRGGYRGGYGVLRGGIVAG